MISRRSVSRFVGRALELERLSSLMEAGAPLITLTGAPGVGKTMLLQQWRSIMDFDAAGWRALFVDGSRCHDEDSLMRAIADVARIELGAPGDEDDARDPLSGAPTMLLIDGIDAIARTSSELFERWLARAPELRFIVTSRKRLGSRTEHLLTVAPLDLTSSESLLLECLGDLAPDLRDAVACDPALPEMLAALGGLPLAVELAAGRCRLLAPEEITRRQKRREPVLGEPIEAAIASSVAMLTPDEARLFGALAVFESEFDLDAAMSVCVQGSDQDVIEQMQALSDASLLQLRYVGSKRLIWMLPPIRAHARRMSEAQPVRDSSSAVQSRSPMHPNARSAILENALTNTSLRVSEIRLAKDGRWFRAAGLCVSCGHRPVMRRLLLALASARLESPGRSLGRDELLRHGWGLERMLETSARHRLEVMISRIRALGIDDALETTETGYRIHRSCHVTLAEESI